MTPEELGELIHGGRGAAELPAYLAGGGDVNAVDPRAGWPLLHVACDHLNLDAILALANAGADLNVLDSSGQAPLHIAVDSDIQLVQANGAELRFETTRLLLSLGADPNVRDKQGLTPRDWAAQYGSKVNTTVLDEFDRRFKIARV